MYAHNNTIDCIVCTLIIANISGLLGSFRKATQRAVRRRKQPTLTVLHSSGRRALQALSQMNDAAQPKFPSYAYDVTIHTLTKTARVIVCVHVMHERIPSPRKVSDWLILQLCRGFQYDPIFGDYRCGFEGYAVFQACNYANCQNLHTTRTI